MVQNSDIIDLLIVEDNENVLCLFNEISKIFGLNVKFASNLDDFINVILDRDPRFILCNMHIETDFSGLILSRMYDKIRKSTEKDALLYFYSFQNNKTLELAKLIIDDLADSRYANFYEFMDENFPLQFKQYFSSEQFKQSITA